MGSMKNLSPYTSPVELFIRNEKSIRVLVVDDSAFMRGALKKIIESDPNIEVIATARDGEEAIEKIKSLKPDVVTLDLDMPRVDGFAVLEVIMKESPLPVIVVSALTQKGADTAFRALDLGAIDYVPKDFPNSPVEVLRLEKTLISKIKAAASARRGRWVIKDKGIRPSAGLDRSSNIHVVVIGASTGGPKALQEIISSLPEDFPAGVLIVIHMPPVFTSSFAQRLDSISRLKVKEAQNEDYVEPGRVFIAPGGYHMGLVEERPSRVKIRITSEPSDLPHIPSVDLTMLSVAEIYNGNALGIILTGMGTDGLKGMTAIKQRGGKTLAQDEETCVVFGMPQACINRGIVDKVVPLPEMADEIVRVCGGGRYGSERAGSR